jgi:hypothetical protein
MKIAILLLMLGVLSVGINNADRPTEEDISDISAAVPRHSIVQEYSPESYEFFSGLLPLPLIKNLDEVDLIRVITR